MDDNKTNFFNITMCGPAAPALMWATLAMSAASAGASYVSQKDAAKAQNSFAAEQAKQGEINAKNAFVFNTNQETQKAIQQNDADSFELQRIHKERLQKQGEAVASSSSQGTNIDQLMAEYEQQEASYRSAISQEAAFKEQQSRATMEGFQSQYKDRVASYAYSTVQKPSAIGAVAGFGAQAASTYYTFKKMQPTGK